MPTFWTGGRRALERGLREQYKQRKEELRVALKQATSMEQRADVSAQIEALKKELSAQLKACGRYIY